MKLQRKQSGQAILESALIMLVFLLIFIGILDFGQFLYFHQSLTERARAGARYSAAHPCAADLTCPDAINVAIYNDPAGAASGASALLPNVNLPGARPDVNKATITATLSSPGTDDARVMVTISNYPYNFVSPYMSKATWFRTVRASESYEIGR